MLKYNSYGINAKKQQANLYHRTRERSRGSLSGVPESHRIDLQILDRVKADMRYHTADSDSIQVCI